jgi:hypothetical protein
MKCFLICSFLIIAVKLSSQQSMELYTIVEYPAVPAKFCSLTEEMKETSGLIYYKSNLWTLNDSGNQPEIYQIDKATGSVSQKVILQNGTNQDWEDITQDENYIYIGDFGNNHGNRNDLKIYKIKKDEISDNKKSEVKAEIIGFSYTDQLSFEESNHNHNFDCEAVISFGDSLIIFSKDWLDGKTRMYKMPKAPGQYKLNAWDTFDADGLVAGADYNCSTGTLVLIGYKNHKPFIFYFSNFNGLNFKGGKVYRFNLNRMKDSQTEGIAWLNDEAVVFSTEQTKTYVQQVFELNLQTVFKLLPE